MASIGSKRVSSTALPDASQSLFKRRHSSRSVQLDFGLIMGERWIPSDRLGVGTEDSEIQHGFKLNFVCYRQGHSKVMRHRNHSSERHKRVRVDSTGI